MGNVTKKDLVEQIAERTGLTQVDTKIVVESFLDAVSGTLQKGNNIEIRGFGRFKIKKKNLRLTKYLKLIILLVKIDTWNTTKQHHRFSLSF